LASLFENLPENEHDKLSLTEELQQLNMKISPNPNTGNFDLLFSEEVSGGNIQIFNAVGQLIYSQKMDERANEYHLNLAENLGQGVYYLCWNNNNFVINQKLIVN
jgi:methionine-rich copper-binding protein CopC